MPMRCYIATPQFVFGGGGVGIIVELGCGRRREEGGDGKVGKVLLGKRTSTYEIDTLRDM